jgi:hypothetical protein
MPEPGQHKKGVCEEWSPVFHPFETLRTWRVLEELKDIDAADGLMLGDE